MPGPSILSHTSMQGLYTVLKLFLSEPILNMSVLLCRSRVEICIVQLSYHNSSTNLIGTINN
jgi:hypothetical protein